MYASHLPSGRPCPVSSGAISAGQTRVKTHKREMSLWFAGFRNLLPGALPPNLRVPSGTYTFMSLDPRLAFLLPSTARERDSALIAAGTTMFSTARISPHYWQRTIRLIRNSGKDGWLDVGKLSFGRKAVKLHTRMDSSAVSFPLSFS